MIIDGKAIADDLLAALASRRKRLGAVTLAAVVVGSTAETKNFLAAKERTARAVGIDLRVYEFNPASGRHKLREQISQLVRSRINAVILQLPLPDHLPTQYLLNAIVPTKDPDCLSTRSVGLFISNTSIVHPPAVEVVAELCRRHDIVVSGRRVLVVGYGRLIGKPVCHFLAAAGAIVTVVPEPSNQLSSLLADAELIISGAGVPNLIQTCRPGATLIDFGCSAPAGQIVGDVDFEAVRDRAGLVTPTPSGTGPILVAVLMANVIRLAERQQQ